MKGKEREKKGGEQKRKFLDFGADRFVPGPGIRKLARVFWPADMFRVTFPQRPDADRETNAFERLVLRLLEAGTTRSVQDLAAESCLPEDLLGIVVRQLQDKHFIDGTLRPDSASLEKLGLGGGEDSPGTFATAVVFREALSGRLLPFLRVLSGSAAIRRGEGVAEDFSPWSGRAPAPPPSRDEIHALLRSLRAGSRLSGAAGPKTGAGLVTVENRPERVNLSCMLYFEQDTGRVMVSNPFGDGSSAVLTLALEDVRRKDASLHGRMAELEEAFCETAPAGRSGTNRSTDHVTPQTRERYPKFADKLATSGLHPFLSASNIHSALEWALFYACGSVSVESALALLEAGFRPEELFSLLRQAALELGFEGNGQNGKPFAFRPVPPGKILDFRNGRADMGTLLAIGLLQASADPDSAPLAAVARSFPDFFKTLDELWTVRDAQFHGEKNDSRAGHTPILERLLPVFGVLLPDAKILLDGATAPAPDADGGGLARRIRDKTIAARLKLQSEFGFSSFSRLGETQIANLVHARQNAEDSGGNVNRVPFATCMANVLQTFLMERISCPDFREAISRAPFEQILASRKTSLGLAAALDRPAFRVNARHRQKAAAGEPATLGACILCLVAWEDEGILRVLLDQCPGFVGTVGDLLDLRGHGNDAVFLSPERFAPLRDNAFSLTKTLLETLPCP